MAALYVEDRRENPKLPKTKTETTTPTSERKIRKKRKGKKKREGGRQKPLASHPQIVNSKFDCNCRRFGSALLGVGCVQIWSARVAKFPLRDLPRAPLDFLFVLHVCISEIDTHVSRTTGRLTAGFDCGSIELYSNY